ncbi:hydrogenase/urease accessory protein HupE [Paenibacillus sp. PastF-3]|uniref:HupE/UreJ family protein n=1 Tax=Paenibacillus sp. PastF-3 TaxID=2940626 RepID=UPI002473BD72|nr:HupE/UreJ family protein [Paenibacillus sp. PastF-3]MDH6370455.1 hydrogenase/urease accessory protein HupE [Paenibacillus sp. PastF-3]
MSARKNRSNLLKSLIFIVIFLISMTSSQLTASAHPLSASYTTVTFDKDKTDFSFSLDVISIIESMDNVDINGNGILEENEIESNKHRLEEWIEDSVILEMNDQQQAPELQDLFLDKKGDKEVLTWNSTYPAFEPGQTIAINDGLYSQATSSPYVNLITAHNGNQTSETVMQGKDRTWTLLLTEDQQEQQLSSSTNSSSSGSSGSSSDWFSFFKLGMNHILTGYDHLLFLFALLLRKQTLKQYAAIITAFTLAHSITLTLAVLGWISLPSRVVESVIALSICYVALENIFRKKIRFRALITFLFGLIHGIGFADILQEMNLPKAHLAVDLVSFNVGIEFIQLCIVIVLLPVLIFLQKRNFYKPVIAYGSWLITALGAFWLVERLFF